MHATYVARWQQVCNAIQRSSVAHVYLQPQIMVLCKPSSTMRLHVTISAVSLICSVHANGSEFPIANPNPKPIAITCGLCHGVCKTGQWMWNRCNGSNVGFLPWTADKVIFTLMSFLSWTLSMEKNVFAKLHGCWLIKAACTEIALCLWVHDDKQLWCIRSCNAAAATRRLRMHKPWVCTEIK